MGLVNSNGGLIESVLPKNPDGLIKSFVRNNSPLNPNNWRDTVVERKVRDEAVYRSSIPFGHTGLFIDKFTGLTHAHFRDMDPISNRWYSKDTAGYMDGLNLYNNYAGVNSVDRDGQVVITGTLVVGFSIKMAVAYLATQAAFATAETGLEYLLHDEDADGDFGIGATFGKNFLLNTITVGIGGKTKLFGKALGAARAFALRQSIEIGIETGFDVGYRGRDWADSLLLNSIGGIGGELAVRGLMKKFSPSVRKAAAAKKAAQKAKVDAIELAKHVGEISTKARILAAGGFTKAERRFLMKHGVVCFVAGTQIKTEQGLKNIEDIKVGDKVWSKPENDQNAEPTYKEVKQLHKTNPTELIHLTYARSEQQEHASFRKQKLAENEDSDSAASRIAGLQSGNLSPSSEATSNLSPVTFNLSSSSEATSNLPPASEATLVGTPNHPFWSVDREFWVLMGNLVEGERLLLADGSEATIQKIERERAAPGETFTTYNFEVAEYHTYYAVGADSDDDKLAVWVHNASSRPCKVGGTKGEVLIKHRAGNMQVRVNGNVWNLPKGMSVDDIPSLDDLGDELQSAVTSIAAKWSKAKLTTQEARAISRAFRRNEAWLGVLLEKQARGRWVERQIKTLHPHLKFQSIGPDLSINEISYDIMSGTQFNRNIHSKRMAEILFRMIEF